MGHIESNYRKIRTRIRKLAAIAQRDAERIRIICVSKGRSTGEIMSILEQGHRDFGENRLEEVEDKWLSLKKHYPDVRLHFIGALQSRKIRSLTGICDIFHSVASLKHMRKLVALGEARYFLQINIGREAQKTGLDPEEIGAFLAALPAGAPGPLGLSCLPPQGRAAAPYLAATAMLAQKHALKELSMGMSADYTEAIYLGATSLRIGRAFFASDA